MKWRDAESVSDSARVDGAPLSWELLLCEVVFATRGRPAAVPAGETPRAQNNSRCALYLVLYWVLYVPASSCVRDQPLRTTSERRYVPRARSLRLHSVALSNNIKQTQHILKRF